jgi:hypothetical protein
MATKERSLDIFTLLDQIDRKNFDIWESLTEEQRKDFSPLVVMRWMSGSSSIRQTVFLNEIVNPVVFSLGDHKEFLMKLLTVCSSGEKKRYSWKNYKLSGSKNSKHAVELISSYYNLSLKEAEDSLKLFSPEEILELGELHGLQKDELRNLKKEVSK